MPRRTIAILTLIAAVTLLAGCPSTSEETASSAPEPAPSPATDATTDETMPGSETDTAAASPTLEPVELATIARAHLFGDIYLTGQPSEDDFFAVRDAGVRTVINQRHDRENSEFNEQQVVTDLGMDYLSIAFGAPDELTDEVLDQTRAQFREAARPMLIHCASANRTGATWLAYAVLDRRLTWDEALAEARTVGLRTDALVEVVRDYVERKQDAE